MKVEWWPIDRPKPYEKNARKIPQKAIDKVALSLREFGWQQPISVDKHGVIVAGHTRLLAAKQEKHEKVPVVIASNLTPAQIRAYRIMDNRSHQETEWDDDILGLELGELKGLDLDLGLTGFDPRELDKLFGIEKAAPEAEMDRAEELLAKWKVERGQIWQIGRHRLMCGDCTNREDVAELMQGEKAQMLFTDPPYGVNYEGGHFHSGDVNIKRKREKLEADDNAEIYSEFLPATLPFVDGPCYMWFAHSKGFEVFRALEENRCTVSAVLVWHKTNATYAAMNAQYKQRHEPCLYFKPSGSTLRWVGASTESTLWEEERDGQNTMHPTQKPVCLAARAIHNHDALTVLDVFAGSGSTIVAAENNKRNGYGMELSAAYCAVILERMAAMGVVGELAKVHA